MCKWQMDMTKLSFDTLDYICNLHIGVGTLSVKVVHYASSSWRKCVFICKSKSNVMWRKACHINWLHLYSRVWENSYISVKSMQLNTTSSIMRLNRNVCIFNLITNFVVYRQSFLKENHWTLSHSFLILATLLLMTSKMTLILLTKEEHCVEGRICYSGHFTCVVLK